MFHGLCINPQLPMQSDSFFWHESVTIKCQGRELFGPIVKLEPNPVEACGKFRRIAGVYLHVQSISLKIKIAQASRTELYLLEIAECVILQNGNYCYCNHYNCCNASNDYPSQYIICGS